MSMAPSTSSGGTSFLLPFRTSKCKGCLVIHAKYLLSLDIPGGSSQVATRRACPTWIESLRDMPQRLERMVLPNQTRTTNPVSPAYSKLGIPLDRNPIRPGASYKRTRRQRVFMLSQSRVILWCVLASVMLPVAASADPIQLRRDNVIPVVMQTELSISKSHAGDVFRADASDTHMLPPGSHLEGVVNRVVPKDGKKHAFMDIEFTTIILPDGHRTNFQGTPIPLSKNYVTQDRDGRWTAKKGVSKDTVVLGSAAGGLILGSMIHKPFEGTFVGLLIGAIAAETDKDDVGDG